MSRNLLIHNATVVTVNSEDQVIQNGFVLVENDRIKDVGPQSTMRSEYKDSELVIDADRKLVLPGLISGHTHIALTLLRGFCDGLTFDELVKKRLWPFERALKPSDSYEGARLGCVDMIRAGVTCFADMHFNMSEVARAVGELGLRASLSVAMMDLEGPAQDADSVRKNEELVRDWHRKAEGRITCMYGPCTVRTASKDLFIKARELADRDHVGCHIHLSEVKDDVIYAKRKYRRRPVAFLQSIGFLADDVLAAHGVWVDESEIRQLRKSRANIVHNPSSNARLAVGMAPIVSLLKNGVNVGLGFDTPILNPTTDMFQEVRAASLIQTVNQPSAARTITSRSLIRMATINNARALQLDGEIGSIEIGKKADMIIVNFDPSFLPMLSLYAETILSHLAFSSTGRDVETTIIDGKVLMANRRLLDIDELQIRQRAYGVAEDVLKRSGLLD